jgi:hypothetical protein
MSGGWRDIVSPESGVHRCDCHDVLIVLLIWADGYIFFIWSVILLYTVLISTLSCHTVPIMSQWHIYFLNDLISTYNDLISTWKILISTVLDQHRTRPYPSSMVVVS